MSFSRVALNVLRFGTGIYLIFTAFARIFAPIGDQSILSLYSSLGLAPTNQGAVYYGITALIAVIGLLLVTGRLMVMSGILVLLVGLINGLSAIVASITQPMSVADFFALLNLGLRDMFVLAPVGLAILAFDAYIRRSVRAQAVGGVMMFPEEAPTKASSPELLPPKR